ncbi:MAG: aminotransferase class I/II-fold pyridoxal phosphate-dependent enzyme [Planctomycetia bacterium]|nr:aminotransferase class I/II-fold pyridoxal phosphate-dependent enzyme [Planctomycetia bacterium]
MHLDHLPGSFFGPPTLVDLVRHRATHQPHDLAFGYLYDGDSDYTPLSNSELDRRARAIAACLESHDLVGERALLLYPPGFDFITAFFGCLYAGVTAVPVYPPRKNRSVFRIQAIADDCGAKVALTNTEVMGRIEGPLEEVPSLKAVKWLDTNKIPEGNELEWIMPDIHGETLAFLQYTSGSTGTPKGVMLNHANLLHNSAQISFAFENTRSGLGVYWLPNYHDMGLIGGILQPLYVGRPNILMSPMSFLQRPFKWLSAISRYGATVSGGPNFAYELCLKKIKPEQVAQLDLSTWKVAFNGAEPIRPETLDAFVEKFGPVGFRREAFYPCYGLAEATLLVTGGFALLKPTQKWFDAEMLRKGWAVEVSPGAEGGQEMVGNGTTMLDQVLAIVNPETENICMEGEVGEIWTKGPSMAEGYWGRPEFSEQMFHAKIKDLGAGPFFRTGDLGFVWQGELYVSGRLKDMIIWHGVNVYPQDVELTVQKSHSKVRTDAGALFAVEKEGKEILVLVQELERGRDMNYAEIVEAIRREVSSQHELPLDYIVIIKHGSIPKTSSGKIQRHACREDFLNGSLMVICYWDSKKNQLVMKEPQGEELGTEIVGVSGSEGLILQEKEGRTVAQEHMSAEVLSQIPDLEGRKRAVLYPDYLEVEDRGLNIKSVSTEGKGLGVPRGQEVMIGAITVDHKVFSGVTEEETEEDLDVSLDNLGAGDDFASENPRQMLLEVNREGLPEDLATVENISKLSAAVLYHVKKVARERAVGITLRTPITELGMDSLERMDILAAIEENFGGRFPEAVLQDLITGKDVVEGVCKYMGGSAKLRKLLSHAGSVSVEKEVSEEDILAAAKAKEEKVPEEYYVFEKSHEYRQLMQTMEAQMSTGLRNPYFLMHEGQAKDTTMIGGKEYIHFASYNYLGFSSDSEVIAETQKAVAKYGTSASASRLVSGEKDIHRDFEREMAAFMGTEDALVFSAGHHVNESVIGHFVGPGDLILHDALAHNSIFMGAKLSGAARRPFEHNNWKMAEELLKRYRGEYRRVLIVLEGVYSMDGDIAPVPNFVELKKRHKAYLYVDEAHSLGTLGKRGAGVCDYFGLDPNDGDFWMGTISKSFGSCGGFMAGKSSLIQYLKYTTPGFVFSAAISPAATAAALASLRKLRREPERVERLRKNSALFLKLAKEAGLNTGLSDGTPVIPVILGNSQMSLVLSQGLFDRGINVQPILYPAVEEKAARLRFFMTAVHTEDQIRYTVDALVDEMKKYKK